MGPGNHPSPASQLREQLLAETILARMDAIEETAVLAEEHPLSTMRQRFAKHYVQLVGIEPELRHELQPILEGIKETGQRPVQDAIDELRAHYVNGLGRRGDGDSSTGS